MTKYTKIRGGTPIKAVYRLFLFVYVGRWKSGKSRTHRKHD